MSLTLILMIELIEVLGVSTPISQSNYAITRLGSRETGLDHG